MNPDFDARLNESDMVNHPSHYKSEMGLEVIDVIEAFTSDLQGIEATDTGNIIKYICRWNHKNGIEDLKKAQWYLNHLISKVEAKEYDTIYVYDSSGRVIAAYDGSVKPEIVDNSEYFTVLYYDCENNDKCVCDYDGNIYYYKKEGK